jgi:hypothetical protein
VYKNAESGEFFVRKHSDSFFRPFWDVEIRNDHVLLSTSNEKESFSGTFPIDRFLNHCNLQDLPIPTPDVCYKYKVSKQIIGEKKIIFDTVEKIEINENGRLEEVSIKSFVDFVIGQMSAQVAAAMETTIWTGANATSGQFAGISTQIALDAALPAAQEVAGTTVDAGDVITELGKLVDAIPARLYGHPDLKLYVAQNIYKAYVRALGGFAASGVGANGYDNKGTNQVLGDVFFDGIPVFMANGMAANTAIATPSSNLHFATGLLNDMNEVQIIDMSPVDGSQNARFIMRFTADAKYGFAEDMVTYGITNSAN